MQVDKIDDSKRNKPYSCINTKIDGVNKIYIEPYTHLQDFILKSHSTLNFIYFHNVFMLR
jgi:hypothetical protein